MLEFISLIEETLFSLPPALKIFGFILIHILLATLFVPCSPLTITAGILWGGFEGLIISIIAALSSCATTFYLSKTFLRKKISSHIAIRYPNAFLLIKRIENNSWKAIGLTSINPLMPASSGGYFFGLTNIKLKKYLAITTFFSLPMHLLYVLTGSSIRTFFSEENYAFYFFAIPIILLFFYKKKDAFINFIIKYK